MKSPLPSKAGQALPEYATILALVVVVCAVALVFFGESISDFLINTGDTMVEMSPN